MGHTNTTITAPISLHADVYSVLGVSKSGTYYDVGYINSNAHGRTNIWSRNKPMRVNTVGNLTEQQKHDAAFGLSATFSATQDPIWSYLAPRPGTDWCRLADFEGYNHASSCGLAFKNYNYTKDLFNDKTALSVAIQDSTSLITPYDLRDTIFKGMRLRLHMTNNQDSGQAYDVYANIDRQSIVFTLAYDQLLLRGAGTYNLTIYGVTSSNETRRIFPPAQERGYLTMTNDTGISVAGWTTSQPSLQVRDGLPLYQYMIGSYNNTLNLTDSNLLFSNVAFNNKAQRSLSNSTIYLVFEWDVTSGTAVKRVPMRQNGTTAWGSTGEIAVNNLGCGNSEMPQLTTSSQVNQYTRIYMAYKHTDNNYYSITPKITVRIKRDNGTSPDFTNPN